VFWIPAYILTPYFLKIPSNITSHLLLDLPVSIRMFQLKVYMMHIFLKKSNLYGKASNKYKLLIMQCSSHLYSWLPFVQIPTMLHFPDIILNFLTVSLCFMQGLLISVCMSHYVEYDMPSSNDPVTNAVENKTRYRLPLWFSKFYK
jgi:hypothetical protein